MNNQTPTAQSGPSAQPKLTMKLAELPEWIERTIQTIEDPIFNYSPAEIANALRHMLKTLAETPQDNDTPPVGARDALIIHLRAAVSIGRPLLHSDVDEIEAALTGKADGGDADSYVIHTEVGDLKCSLAVCCEWEKLVEANAALEAAITGKTDGPNVLSADYEAGFKEGMKFQAKHFDAQPAATGADLQAYLRDYQFLYKSPSGLKRAYTPNTRDLILIEDAIRGWDAREA